VEKIGIFFWPLVILFVLFMVSFFLSLSETAFIALSKIRLRNLVNMGDKNAKVASKIAKRPDRLITTILVGNNVVNVAISVIGTAIFIHFYGLRMGMLMSTAIISLAILMFAEITPKMFAAQHPEKVALFAARPISLLVFALRPITVVLTSIGNFLNTIMGNRLRPRRSLVTEEEIKLMIEVGKEEGAVSDEERKMLVRIFKFGDTRVGEVMTAKDKIAAVKIDATGEEVLDLVAKEGYGRIPIYKDAVDNIVGIVYSRDLLQVWHSKRPIVITELMQPAYFVHKDKRVSEMLRDFLRMKIQIAIVVDENQKTLGLVTLEDLIEEIVGEIEEEYK